jgi:hypothetical protein
MKTTMCRTFLLMLPLLLSVAAVAQQNCRFVVTDGETGLPVMGAYIRSSTAKVLGSTNQDGVAVIKAISDTPQLTISHIAYNDTTLNLLRSVELYQIRMTPNLRQLRAFTVFSAPAPLLADKPYYVTSYVHSAAGLLLFATPQKMPSRSSFYLLDTEGNVLASCPWSKQGVLFEDAAGDVWFRGKDQTVLLSVTGNNIMVTETSMPSRDFDAGIARIEVANGDRYYFKNLQYDNQRADFYCYDDQTGKCSSFLTIADPLGMKLRETRDIFETNDFERRFSEMCFFKPVFAPITTKGDTILIFDFIGEKILTLDRKEEVINETAIAVLCRKNLQRELIRDKVTGKFYVLCLKAGISTICEADPLTGNPGMETIIPSFPYIKDISVNNGVVYFLYRETGENSYQRIYRMPLGVMMASN